MALSSADRSVPGSDKCYGDPQTDRAWGRKKAEKGSLSQGQDLCTPVFSMAQDKSSLLFSQLWILKMVNPQ